MKRVAVTGFAIWAFATIALRLAGQTIFRDVGNAAIMLVASGMLLDAISAIWFSTVFPDIRADAAGVFGGWLLFCNIVVLLTAAVTPRRTRCAS